MSQHSQPTRRRRITNRIEVVVWSAATIVLFGLAIFFQSTGVQ